MVAFGMDISVPLILCEAATVARLIMDDPKTHTLTGSATTRIELVLQKITHTNSQLK